MAEVVRLVEGVERALPQLVQVEVVALLRVVVRAEAEDPGFGWAATT